MMKTKLSLLLILLGGVPLVAADSQRVGLDEVPAAVQRAIEHSKDRGLVREITRRTVDGRVIYEVEFEKKHALNPKLRLAEDGTLLRDSRGVSASVDTIGEPVATLDGITPLPGGERRSLLDLPAAVQATVKRDAGGREIADIDEEVWDGRKVYEIEFRQPGMNPQVCIAEDGTIVKDETRPKTFKQWFKGTQFEDTPRAVQDTIRREVGPREIVDIDRKLRSGQPVYEVEARGSQSSFQLEIAADGTVRKDSRHPSP